MEPLTDANERESDLLPRRDEGHEGFYCNHGLARIFTDFWFGGVLTGGHVAECCGTVGSEREGRTV